MKDTQNFNSKDSDKTNYCLKIGLVINPNAITAASEVDLNQTFQLSQSARKHCKQILALICAEFI